MHAIKPNTSRLSWLANKDKQVQRGWGRRRCIWSLHARCIHKPSDSVMLWLDYPSYPSAFTVQLTLANNSSRAWSLRQTARATKCMRHLNFGFSYTCPLDFEYVNSSPPYTIFLQIKCSYILCVFIVNRPRYKKRGDSYRFWGIPIVFEKTFREEDKLPSQQKNREESVQKFLWVCTLPTRIVILTGF